MQRTRRGLQIPEIVEAFNEIIEIISNHRSGRLKMRQHRSETRSLMRYSDVDPD